jgi:type IV secretory pathway TrbL component
MLGFALNSHSELLGPELCCKVVTAIIILLIIGITIAILPIFLGDFFSSLLAQIATQVQIPKA